MVLQESQAATPSGRGGALRLEVVRDDRGLSALRNDWTAVLGASADRSPFLTWEWADAWRRSFPGRDRPYVIVVRDGSAPVAIAPLLRCGGVAGRVPPVYIGIGQEAADYGGILLGNRAEEAGALLFDHLDRLVARGGVVLLTRLTPDGDCLRLLRSRYEDRRDSQARVTELFAEDYPYLDLSALDDPGRHVSRAWKANDVRRRLRRLSEQWPVEFVYHRSPVAHPSALDDFFRLHDARWDAKQDATGARPAGLFATAAGRRFVRAAAEAADRAGWLRLSFVDVDGKPSIGRFGMEFDGCYYGLKSAFEPELRAYGPGHLVVGFLLQEAVALGLNRFDFMRGAGEHKKAWAGGARPIGYYALHRAGRLGDAQLRYAWTVLRWRNLRRFTEGGLARVLARHVRYSAAKA